MGDWSWAYWAPRDSELGHSGFHEGERRWTAGSLRVWVHRAKGEGQPSGFVILMGKCLEAPQPICRWGGRDWLRGSEAGEEGKKWPEKEEMELGEERGVDGESGRWGGKQGCKLGRRGRAGGGSPGSSCTSLAGTGAPEELLRVRSRGVCSAVDPDSHREGGQTLPLAWAPVPVVARSVTNTPEVVKGLGCLGGPVG